MNCIGGSAPRSGKRPAQQRLDAGDARWSPYRPWADSASQNSSRSSAWRSRASKTRRSTDSVLFWSDEEAEAVLALLLGAIHRHVGVLGQRRFVLAVLREDGDADAGGGAAFEAAELERLARSRRAAGAPRPRSGAASEACSRMTTNSSPPSRATASPARRQRAQAAATSRPARRRRRHGRANR